MFCKSRTMHCQKKHLNKIPYIPVYGLFMPIYGSNLSKYGKIQERIQAMINRITLLFLLASSRDPEYIPFDILIYS